MLVLCVLGLVLSSAPSALSWPGDRSAPYEPTGYSPGRSSSHSASGCSRQGQFLRNLRDPCTYRMCVAGSTYLQHHKVHVHLTPKNMPCAPGTSVPADYREYSMVNPCTRVDSDTCPRQGGKKSRSSGYDSDFSNSLSYGYDMGTTDYKPGSYNKLFKSFMPSPLPRMAPYDAKTLRDVPEISKQTGPRNFYRIMFEKLNGLRRSLEQLEGKRFRGGPAEENGVQGKQMTDVVNEEIELDWREPIMEPIMARGHARSRHQTASGYGLRASQRMHKVKVKAMAPPAGKRVNYEQTTMDRYQRRPRWRPLTRSEGLRIDNRG